MVFKQVKKFLLFFAICIIISSCSHNSTGSSNPKDFKQRRSPRDNDFIKNGGYKIKKPTNPFTSVNEVKQELKYIPPIPDMLKNTEQKEARRH